MSRPLDALGSIKVKLGALVAASVVVATVLALLGAAAGIPVVLTIPVTVALALAVTQLLAAGMVAPLREMTDVAQQMARGDLSGRVVIQTGDEVGRLAVAFNRMAADLARVDEERRDLIATVSHELRTPVAAMTAVLENVADGVVPADQAHLRQAVDQAARLRELLEDLLDLSRLEAGVARLDLQETALAPLIADCVTEVQTAGRLIDYDVVVPSDLTVQADPARLRQLVVNLLDNAGRHSRGERAVVIAASDEGEHWWLEVVDDGPGVPVAERDRVFERFGTARAGGGTGLGLAISRWVAQLHGGSLRFLDPAEGQQGARLRLDIPGTPRRSASATPAESLQSSPAPAAPASIPVPSPQIPTDGLDGLFGRFWPERRPQTGLMPVVLSSAVGLLAGAIMTFTGPGLSWMLVLMAAGAAALVCARHRAAPFTLVCSTLAALLVLPLALLGNQALAVMSVFVSAALFLIGTTAAQTVPGFVLSWLSWPLASLRGLPWFGRALRLVDSTGPASAMVRTAVWSAIALAVFGALFASADVLFATWIDVLVPSLTFDDLVTRLFVAVAVFGMTLAAVYLAINPSRVDPVRRTRPPLGNRFEWLVPVLLVDGIFALFMIAQATVIFGGHDYLERTTGVTYADYVHQGFGQLTLATALTLLVVWAASRRAGQSAADQWWLRGSLGLLLSLTLVVVASALHRMHLYQQAYGFTTLRLLVDVFEAWLGAVVIVVVVTGALGLGRWVPRIALVSGALALLGLLAVNPDRWVAERNIDRYETTGKLDLSYLQSLSTDATGVIASRLPPEVSECALKDRMWDLERHEDTLSGWNLGQQRAAKVLKELDVTSAELERRCDYLGREFYAGSPGER